MPQSQHSTNLLVKPQPKTISSMFKYEILGRVKCRVNLLVTIFNLPQNGNCILLYPNSPTLFLSLIMAAAPTSFIYNLPSMLDKQYHSKWQSISIWNEKYSCLKWTFIFAIYGNVFGMLFI